MDLSKFSVRRICYRNDGVSKYSVSASTVTQFLQTPSKSIALSLSRKSSSILYSFMKGQNLIGIGLDINFGTEWE